MKKIHIYKRLCCALVWVGAFAACSEDILDRINKDRNNPIYAASKFMLTEVMTNTAFSIVGADLSLYGSVYIEHEGGTWNQFYNADVRVAEPTAAATYNNCWTSLYYQIRNCKIVIEKCAAEGDESDNKLNLGIAQVMLAYNSAILTDLFGDTPWSENHASPIVMQPKLDTQQEIYAAIMQNLDAAIANLAGAANTMGAQDLIYNGNAEAWVRAAYGLKARYTMRLLHRSANAAADLNKILEYIDKSFTLRTQEFAYNYNGSNTNNPYARFWNDRNNLGASQSFVDKLKERNDPRITEIYIADIRNGGMPRITDPNNLVLIPNGQGDQIQLRYHLFCGTGALTAPTLLMSYHELLFLKAEALCRLNNGNANAASAAALKEAVGAAFANTARTFGAAKTSFTNRFGADWGNTTLDDAQTAADYFDDTVAWLFNANGLQELMVQKYMAMFGANGEAIEAYNDYRRLKGMGEGSFIKMNNPGQFPLRYTYGNADVTTNKNVAAAFGDGFYVYSEPVWWAGGSR